MGGMHRTESGRLRTLVGVAVAALMLLAAAAPAGAARHPDRSARKHAKAGSRPHKIKRLHVARRTRRSVTLAWKRPRGRRHGRRHRHAHVARRVVIKLNGRRVAGVRRRRHRLTLRRLHCGRRYRVAALARDRHGHRSRPARRTVHTAGCAGGPAPTPAPAPPLGSAAPGGGPRIFAYYYLWWSSGHWKSTLGSKYPLTANPLPLPARLDADGCNPTANFAGATVTDVPARIYSQDDPGFIEADVREAAAAGLSGFAVNWLGTGGASQSPTSNVYSRRLQVMVDAVHRVNAEGIPFKLWLSLKASASVLPPQAVANDLGYFARTYGNDPAFDRTRSGRPTVIWNGSRKYATAALRDVSAALRPKLRILGDETTWSADRAPYLDGDAYYWSSQDPYGNPQSFDQLRALAGAVRGTGRNPDGSGKAFIAPLAPGFDTQLAGGSTCVPRRGGDTLRRLYAGNRATRPEAWALISWNEIVEGTYVDPMTRYGRQELDVVRSLVGGG